MKLPTNFHAIVAAGGWNLSTEFLSAKAKAQARDKHGRFIPMGGMVRWMTQEGMRWGFVVGKAADGKTISVQENGKSVVAKVQPKQLEVVKALIPSDKAEAKNLADAQDWAKKVVDAGGKTQHSTPPKATVPDAPPKVNLKAEALHPDDSPQELPLYVDTTGFKKVGGQSGSNQGGVYEGPNGEQYYVKKAQSEQHAANEVLTARLYKEAGVGVPDVYLTEFEDGSPAVASKIVPGLKPLYPNGTSTPSTLKAGREGFAMDAWLSNWDSIGLVYDNMMATPDGKPVRVDTGGGLLYRAQGSPKGGLFSDTVGETETLRDPGMNPQAAKIFGGMSNSDIANDIENTVNKVSPDKIHELVNELPFSSDAVKSDLVKKLMNRKADLNTKFDVPAAPEPVKEEPKAVVPDAPDYSTKPPGDPYGYTEMTAEDVKAGDWVRYDFGYKNKQSYMALESFKPGDKYLTVGNADSINSSQIPVNAGTKLPVYKPPVGGLPAPQPVKKNLDGTIPTMAINLNKGDLVKVKGAHIVELDSKFSTTKGVTGKYLSGNLAGGSFQQKAHKSDKFSVLDPDSAEAKAAKGATPDAPAVPDAPAALKDAPTVTNGDFTLQEFDALDDYTGDSHAPINKYLRGGLAYGMAEEDIEAIADHLFTAINKSTVQNDSVVYRGIADEDFDLEPGSIMHDKAFVSTSSSLEKAAEFSKFGKGPGAIFEIDLPKGANAIDVTKAGVGGYGEKEFLLNRDSLFEITDVSVQSDGKKYIKAKYLLGAPGGGKSKPSAEEVHGDDSGGAGEGVPGAHGLGEGPGHGDTPGEVTTGVTALTQPLDHSEKTALLHYTQNSAPANTFLRTGEVKTSPLIGPKNQNEIAYQIAKLDTALNKTTIAQDSTFYRGVQKETLDALESQGLLKNGSTFVDKAFVSATTSQNDAEKWAKTPAYKLGPKKIGALFIIKAPKGTKGAVLADAGAHSEVNGEVLLHRNQGFKVTSDWTDDQGLRHIELEVVPAAAHAPEAKITDDSAPSAAPDLSPPAPLDEPNKSKVSKAAAHFQPGDVLAPHGSKVTAKILSVTPTGDGQYEVHYQKSSNQASNFITLEGDDSTTFGTLVKGADAPPAAVDSPTAAVNLKPGDKVAYGSKTWTVKSVAPGTGPNAGKTVVDLGGGGQVFPNDYKFGEAPSAPSAIDEVIAKHKADPPKVETLKEPDAPHPAAKIGVTVTSKKDGFSGKVIKVNPNSGYSLVQSADGSKKLWRKWDTLGVAKDEPAGPTGKSSSVPLQNFFDALPEGLDLPDDVNHIFNKMGFLDDINIGEENTADEWVTNLITEAYADGDLESGDAVGNAYEALKKDAGIEDGFQWGSPGSNAPATPDSADEYTDTLPEHATAANLLNEELSSSGMLDFFGELDMNASAEEKKSWLLDAFQGADESGVTLEGPLLDALKNLADALGVPVPDQQTHEPSPMSPAVTNYPASDLVAGDVILYNGQPVEVGLVTPSGGSTALFIQPVGGGVGKTIWLNPASNAAVTKKTPAQDDSTTLKPAASLQVGDKIKADSGEIWTVTNLTDASGGYQTKVATDTGNKSVWFPFDANVKVAEPASDDTAASLPKKPATEVNVGDEISLDEPPYQVTGKVLEKNTLENGNVEFLLEAPGNPPAQYIATPFQKAKIHATALSDDHKDLEGTTFVDPAEMSEGDLLYNEDSEPIGTISHIDDNGDGYDINYWDLAGKESTAAASYGSQWMVKPGGGALPGDDMPAVSAGPQTLPASELKAGDKILDVDGDAGHIELIEQLPTGKLKVTYKVDDYGDQLFTMNVDPSNHGYFKKIGEGTPPTQSEQTPTGTTKGVKDYKYGDKILFNGKSGKITTSEASSQPEYGDWFLSMDLDDGSYESGWVSDNPDGTVKFNPYGEGSKTATLTPADSAPTPSAYKVGDKIPAAELEPGMIFQVGIGGNKYKVNSVAPFTASHSGQKKVTINMTNVDTGEKFLGHTVPADHGSWTLVELPDGEKPSGPALEVGDEISPSQVKAGMTIKHMDGADYKVLSVAPGPTDSTVKLHLKNIHGEDFSNYIMQKLPGSWTLAKDAPSAESTPESATPVFPPLDQKPTAVLANDIAPGDIVWNGGATNPLGKILSKKSEDGNTITWNVEGVNGWQGLDTWVMPKGDTEFKVAKGTGGSQDVAPAPMPASNLEPGDVIWAPDGSKAIYKIDSLASESAGGLKTWNLLDPETGASAGPGTWGANSLLTIAKGGGPQAGPKVPESAPEPSKPEVPNGTLVAGSTHVYQDAKGKYVINKKGMVLREGDKVVTKKGETGTISKFELDAKYAKVKMSDGKTKARQIDTLAPFASGDAPAAVAAPDLYKGLNPGEVVSPANMAPGMTLQGAMTGTIYTVKKVTHNPSGTHTVQWVHGTSGATQSKTLTSVSKGYLVPPPAQQPAGAAVPNAPAAKGVGTSPVLAPGKVWKQVDTVKSPDLVPGQVVGNDKKTLEYTKPSTKVSGKQEIKFVEDAEPLTVSKNVNQWQVWEQADPGVIGKKKPENLEPGDIVELPDGTKHIFQSINAFADNPSEVELKFQGESDWHGVPENVGLTVWAQGTPLSSAPSTAEPVGEVQLTHDPVDFSFPEGGTVSVPPSGKVYKSQWWSHGNPVMTDGFNSAWEIDPATGTTKSINNYYSSSLTVDNELFANANTADVEPNFLSAVSADDLAGIKAKIDSYILTEGESYWGYKNNFTALQKLLNSPTLGEDLTDSEWNGAFSAIGSPSIVGDSEHGDKWTALAAEVLKARKKHSGTYYAEWQASQHGNQYHYNQNERKALSALGLSDNANGLITQKYAAPASNPSAAAEIHALVSDADRASVIDDLFGKGTAASIAKKTRGAGFKPALSANGSPYAKEVPDLPKTDGKNGTVIYLGDNVIASDGQGGKVQLVTADGKVRVLRADGTSFTRKGTQFVVTGSPVTSGKPNAGQTAEAKPYVSKPRPEFKIPDWSKGNVGGTSTVGDALTKIKSSEKDGNIGWSFAGDGSQVEELDVRLQRVRNKQGGEFLEVRFKLTPKQGNAMFKRHSADPSWDETNMQIDARQVSQNGKLAQMTGANYHANHKGRTLVKKSTSGTEIRFHRANSKEMSTSAGNPTAYHNLVQIRLPADATPSDIAKAMYDAGVDDPSPATPEAVRRLGENKLLSMFARKTDAWSGNDNVANRDALLEQIKKEWGVTVNDLSIMNGTNGRFELQLPQAVADKIAQKTGVNYFVHSLNSGESDLYQKIGQNPFNALVASAQRELDGVIAAGMSKTADIYTGGADYVFTRPKATMGQMLTGSLVYDAKRLFRRMDWFTRNSDAYGKRSPNMDIVGDTSPHSTETMFKHRMNFDDAIGYLVGNETHRQNLIKTVKSHGITHFGSRTVDDFIIVAPTGNVTAPTPQPETIPVASLLDTVLDTAAPSVGGAPA